MLNPNHTHPRGKPRTEGRLTCCLFVEAVPLHLPAADIRADKVLTVAQEDAVPDLEDHPKITDE